MAAGKLNLKIEQGATFRRRLQWKTGEPATPVDLTGYVARMQVRGEQAASNVLLELTTTKGGIVITDALQGRFELYLKAVDTTALTFDTGVYDLEMVAPDAPDNTVTRLLAGSVSVSPEVTR
jgi:hypothetical protein